MFKRKIKEEKIINGVKTEFNYEVSLLGNKELTHKWERSDDKRIVTYYNGHLIRNNKSDAGSPCCAPSPEKIEIYK